MRIAVQNKLFEGKLEKTESGGFGALIAIMLVIVVLTVVGFIWFLYSGNEPFEPVQDDPHLSLTEIRRDSVSPKK